MFKAHKWALILTIVLILFISALSTVSAQDSTDMETVNNDTQDNPIPDTQINTDDTSSDDDLQLNTEETQSDGSQNSSADNSSIDSNDQEDTVDHNIYYIDNTNYEEYMDYSFEENSIVYITENLEGLDLFVEAFNVTIAGIDNPTLTNSHIIVYEEGYANIYNLTFVSNDESEFLRDVEFIGNNNTISNVDFIDYRYEPTDEDYRVLFVLGNNTSITNCNFDIKYPTQHRDWRYYGAECKEIVILLRGNNNNVTNCTVNLNESGYYEAPYGMLRGISIYGDNNNVSYCNLTLRGTLYCYAISCRGSYNYISFNDIDVRAIRYSNAITLEGQNAYNLMENNNIYVQTFNQTIDDQELTDVSYGIIITENEYHGYTYYIPDSVTIYNVIRNNYIRGNSTHVYGIEQFGGTYTTIENNTIVVDGYSPMGIGLIGKGANITNNRVIARGLSNESGVSADYIKPETTAISLKDGSDNYIANNYLEASHGTVMNLRNERRNVITKNTMNVMENIKYILGDSRVNGSVFTDNIIEGNPLYSSLSNDIVSIKKHTYVDGVIVANDDLESYLAAHKQDSNGTIENNNTDSGQKDNSTDYGNNTSRDSNQTNINNTSGTTPTNSSGDITNQTIVDPISADNNTNNQSTVLPNSTGTNTDNNQTSDEEKTIIDEIIDKIDEMLNQTNETASQNQSVDNDTNVDNQNNTNRTENENVNDTTQENTTEVNNTNTNQSDVVIENQTAEIPVDNNTVIPENTSQVIIEEPTQENQTVDTPENSTDENKTEDNTNQNNTQTENTTQIEENQTTEVIVTNQTENTTQIENNTVIDNQTTNTTPINNTNSTENITETTENTNRNTTENPLYNNTNQSQVDTNSPVTVNVTNNTTTTTNATIEADVEVENSTIKNRTNETTGAGDQIPNDGNPSAETPESSSEASSEPVVLEALSEDVMDDSNTESSPTSVGVTQALSSSSAKVFKVTPKIISKKMSFDDLKYMVAFLLILMSALMLGYKRVEV